MYLKDLLQTGKVRVVVLDDRAQFGKAHGGALTDLGDFRVNWGHPKIGRKGDTRRYLALQGIFFKRNCRVIQRHRITGIVPSHHIEQQCQICHVAGHGTIDCHMIKGQVARIGGHTALARA